MRASGGVLLHLWILDGLARLAEASYNLTFKHTVFPIDPGFEFDPQWATFVANDTGDVSSRDPSFWKLMLNKPKDAPAAKPSALDNYVVGVFTATGLQWSVSAMGIDYNISNSVKVNFTTNWRTEGGAMTNSTLIETTSGNTITAVADAFRDNRTYEHMTAVDFPRGSRWLFDNFTAFYEIPMEE